MSIKCGNCKGHHDTIQEVRTCHEPNSQMAASERQMSYLRTLLADRQHPPDYEQSHDLITKRGVSAAIDELLKMPRLRGWDTQTQEATVKGTLPKHGTYTVTGEKEHRTFRIKKVHPKSDRVVVELLVGPDNLGDFRRIGKAVDGGVFLFREWYNEDSAITEALRVLLNADDKALGKFGFTYALQSGNCYVCGRTLTVPASIHAGIGPVCARKGGGY